MKRVKGVLVIYVVLAEDDLAGSLLNTLKSAALGDADGGRPRWGRVCEDGEVERSGALSVLSLLIKYNIYRWRIW